MPQPTPQTKKSDEYQEVSEKKTSKLGYLLLLIMAVFLIIIGQKVFIDLGRIPERPVSPARCLSSFRKAENISNLSYKPNCYFGEIDQKYGLEQRYRAIEPSIEKIVSYNRQISDRQSQISSKEREKEKLSKQYDLSLQEKIADEDPIMNKDQIKNQINSLRAQIGSMQGQTGSITQQRDREVQSISMQVTALSQVYNEAVDYYKTKSAFYKFKVFGLKLIFVLPFFGLALFFYFRLKRKDSRYTIIVTAVMGASALLFLQIMLVFLYQILPKEWLERVFKALMDIPFLRYIIYYGSVILVIVIFGGIVYFIQRKVFDPERVAIRRLKDNKCPGCSYHLYHEHIFCPKCGEQIKSKCKHCRNPKIRHLTFCPYCGSKK